LRFLKYDAAAAIVVCGSFDEFADDTDADAVKLDLQFLHILDAMSSWEEGRVWMLAYAR
jgi:hypothetical protein